MMSKHLLKKTPFTKLVFTIISLFLLLFFFEVMVVLYRGSALSTSILKYPLIFSLSIAAIFSSIILYFKQKAIPNLIIALLLTFLYGSQLFYYANFQTYYTIFSLSQAGQLTDFYREIVIILIRNWSIFPVVLSVVALMLFIQLKLKDIYVGKTISVFVLIFGLLIHGLGVLLIQLGPMTQKQQYLYFQQPDQAVIEFGLLTSMRLDLKDALLDFLPFVQAKTPPPPVITDLPQVETIETISYNQLNFNWDRLIAQAPNDTIKNMHIYFSSREPTKKNEYTGLLAGKNLIVITAEAFSHYAIRPDITPTLYQLSQEGFIFENFYNPVWGVSTSDGEYVVFTSLMPKNRIWSLARSSTNYMPLTYGRQFLALDYLSMAFHNHTYTYYRRNESHPNLGYEYIGVGNGLNLTKVWPPSDLELMEATVGYYIDKEPFHVYYMTVSGHQFYTFTGNMMSYKNKDVVKDLPYSEHVLAYLASQVELEKGLAYLVNALKEAGVYENTVIAISADHYPYGLTVSEIEELAKQEIDETFELYRSSFILHIPNFESVIIDKPTSSMDILPTLSNLFGLEYDSRLLMGVDVLSDADGMVIFYDRSFIVEQGRYQFSNHTFYPNPGFSLSASEIQLLKNQIDAKFYYSTQILDNDYYGLIWPAIITEINEEIDWMR